MVARTFSQYIVLPAVFTVLAVLSEAKTIVPRSSLVSSDCTVVCVVCMDDVA